MHFGQFEEHAGIVKFIFFLHSISFIEKL